MSIYPIEIALTVDGDDDIELELDGDNEIGMDVDTKIEASFDKHYIHKQIVASDSWTIEHNLHKCPAVSIVDSGGSIVVGEVQYLNQDALIVRFSGAFSGIAYLN